MSSEVELTRTAEADLLRLAPVVADRAIRKMRWLADNFVALKHEPLTGDWQGVFKLRVGAYRVLYSIEEGERIVVHFVRHRREVYRRPGA